MTTEVFLRPKENLARETIHEIDESVVKPIQKQVSAKRLEFEDQYVRILLSLAIGWLRSLWVAIRTAITEFLGR